MSAAQTTTSDIRLRSDTPALQGIFIYAVLYFKKIEICVYVLCNIS